MSERLPHSPEQHKGADKELEKRQQEALRELQEKAKESEHEHQKNLEQIRERAELEAASSEKTKSELAPSDKDEQKSLHINQELKSMAYQRTLKRARNKLPAPMRPLSAFMHQPAVEAVSELGAKTVARPSGILAGGICAFLGSAVVLWISRHYGYEYNFLLFALLFVGGFFVGLILELIIRTMRRRR
jgi:hypothetical protein